MDDTSRNQAAGSQRTDRRFARQAYVDECGGGPTLIEHIQTATEVIGTAAEASAPPRIRVIDDYRCVGAGASAARIEPEPLPASAIENL